MAAKCSRHALGLPGMLMMSVPPPHSGRRPAQHGVRRYGGGSRPHDLGKAGCEPVDHREGGLGRAVPGGESGAAGGEYQIHLAAVRECAEQTLYLVLLVGHDVRLGDFGSHLPQQVAEHRA